MRLLICPWRSGLLRWSFPLWFCHQAIEVLKLLKVKNSHCQIIFRLPHFCALSFCGNDGELNCELWSSGYVLNLVHLSKQIYSTGNTTTMSCRRMTWWSDLDQRNIESCVTWIPSSSTPHKILYWLQSLIWYKTLFRFIVFPRNTIPDRPAGYRQIYTWCLIRGLQMSGHDSEREIPWCEVWKCQQR